MHKERKCGIEIFLNAANFLAEGNMHSQSYAVSFVNYTCMLVSTLLHMRSFSKKENLHFYYFALSLNND
jgi:hypothetical protein